MTTLAIIGNGIAARSLIYTLAKEQKFFEKITVFYSDKFAFPCTLHSTAIVAPRGLSSGHSALGDLLLESFKTFSEHVNFDHPAGVTKITQFTGATTKLENFKSRYPNGEMKKDLGPFSLKNETYVATEDAFLVDPQTYSDWLVEESKVMEQTKHLEFIEDFVISIEENERIHIKTQNGRNLSFDKVVLATGSYTRYWKDIFRESKIKSSKAIQGSYFEFNNVGWSMPSFSLTLDGDNLIWNRELKRLLIGSTTLETHLVLPPKKDLLKIYERLKASVDLPLPDVSKGEIKVGLREKASKRTPYLQAEGSVIFVGGFYKNGYSLGLKMARDLSRQYL